MMNNHWLCIHRFIGWTNFRAQLSRGLCLKVALLKFNKQTIETTTKSCERDTEKCVTIIGNNK